MINKELIKKLLDFPMDADVWTSQCHLYSQSIAVDALDYADSLVEQLKKK